MPVPEDRELQFRAERSGNLARQSGTSEHSRGALPGKGSPPPAQHSDYSRLRERAPAASKKVQEIDKA